MTRQDSLLPICTQIDRFTLVNCPSHLHSPILYHLCFLPFVSLSLFLSFPLLSPPLLFSPRLASPLLSSPLLACPLSSPLLSSSRLSSPLLSLPLLSPLLSSSPLASPLLLVFSSRLPSPPLLSSPLLSSPPPLLPSPLPCRLSGQTSVCVSVRRWPVACEPPALTSIGAPGVGRDSHARAGARRGVGAPPRRPLWTAAARTHTRTYV